MRPPDAGEPKNRRADVRLTEGQLGEILDAVAEANEERRVRLAVGQTAGREATLSSWFLDHALAAARKKVRKTPTTPRMPRGGTIAHHAPAPPAPDRAS